MRGTRTARKNRNKNRIYKKMGWVLLVIILTTIIVGSFLLLKRTFADKHIAILPKIKFNKSEKSNLNIKDSTTATDAFIEEDINKTPNVKSLDLIEDRRVYAQDKGDRVVHLYVTVLKENNISDGKLVTLNDLNRYNKKFQGKEPKVEVIFQEGSPDGPKRGFLGYGTKTANATMELRGNSALNAVQKSFKIRLYDKAGLWNNQSIINLNKHQKDLTRVRNKLAFDYFKNIPNFTSIRTQFVNLQIKDLSSDISNPQFVDYGLFTQIEQPNKAFLRAHGLDPNANLYKAEYFEFFRYPDNLKLSDDPSYSKEEFEKNLEIIGSEDHKKLLTMLDDVNNYTLDINDVVNKHFNRDNMLTWLSVNILLGNFDTQSNNFFLYSPLNSDTWYFMPWDYDKSLGINQQIGSRAEIYSEWESGLSNYWGMVLFNRFFRDPNNVKALNEKIEATIKIINKDRTMELLNTYHDVVSKYVRRFPDINYLPSRVENFEREYKRIADETENNYNNYYKNIQNPMPFFLGEPVFDSNSNKYVFSWDPSFDLQEDDITYDFQLSTEPKFSNVLVNKAGLIDTEFSVEKLTEGIYYWRVLVHDSEGNSQPSFDYFVDSKGEWYFGIKRFTVDNNPITNKYIE